MSDLTIHCSIADGGLWPNKKGQRAVVLWYLLRYLDAQGRGKLYFDFDYAANFFGVAIATVRRWLRAGVKHQLFKSYQLTLGGAWVRLNSRDNVALSLGLTDFGETTDIEIEELKEIKSLTAAATAAKLQRQSRLKALKSSNKHSVPKTSDLLRPSKNALGALFVTGRFAFVGAHVALFGGCQTSVASQLGRSERTVRRRLNNEERERRSLPSIERKQVCQHRPEYDAAYQGNLDLEGLNGKLLYIKRLGKAFLTRCNVYQIELWNRPQRFARSAYKRKLSKLFGASGGVGEGDCISFSNNAAAYQRVKMR